VDDKGSIPDRDNDGIFYLRHCVQPGSGAHPDFYPVGTLGIKWRGREPDR